MKSIKAKKQKKEAKFKAMKESRKKALIFVIISLFIIIADQVSKVLANDAGIATMNTGSAFSLFQGYAYLMIVLSLIVVAIIFYLWPKINKAIIIPVAFIFSGTVGNLIDRVIYKAVIDFIDVGFWPSFNIADTFLVIGAAWLIFYFFKTEYLDKK